MVAPRIPHFCQMLMNDVFVLRGAQVPLHDLFTKEGNPKGKGIFTLFLILLPVLCKPRQFSVCVCKSIHMSALLSLAVCTSGHFLWSAVLTRGLRVRGYWLCDSWSFFFPPFLCFHYCWLILICQKTHVDYKNYNHFSCSHFLYVARTPTVLYPFLFL